MQAIILAAGKSSRFNTTASKLSFTLCGQELLVYPVRLLQTLDLHTTVVLGHQKQELQAILNKYNFSNICSVEQQEQHGTGHALLCTKHLWHEEHIIVINGDMPLVTQETIQKLSTHHQGTGATITFVVAQATDSTITGYGRIIQEGKHVHILEAREFNKNTHEYPLVNAGIYCFKRSFLEKVLPTLHASASGEIYLTDLIRSASTAGEIIETIQVPFDSIQGVNTLKELSRAEQLKRRELIDYWMSQGVRFESPETVHIDLAVTIGKDTVIGASVQLRGQTHIGNNCFIDAFCVIDTSTIGNNTHVYAHSVIHDALLNNFVHVGPYAHVHKKSILGAHVVVGNFVEVSKSRLDTQTKVKHLAYIGQAEISAKVNIGAGVIICNYNGVTKHDTIIHTNAFIGSNSVLVAPVTIGADAFVAAGSVITHNVPADALAIARSVQVIKEQYAHKLKQKHSQHTQKNILMTHEITPEITHEKTPETTLES